MFCFLHGRLQCILRSLIVPLPLAYYKKGLHFFWQSSDAAVAFNFAHSRLYSDFSLAQIRRESGWPSGLRRCVQVAVHFVGVGSNPTSDTTFIWLTVAYCEQIWSWALVLFSIRPWWASIRLDLKRTLAWFCAFTINCNKAISFVLKEIMTKKKIVKM